MIIMMHGLPASGKSFWAKKIGDYLQGKGRKAVVVKSVSTRDPASTVSFTLASIDETVPKTRKEKDESYDKMLLLAKENVKTGKVSILDATFHKKYRREWVYKFCKSMAQDPIIVLCDCNSDARIREIFRKRAMDDSSKDNILNTFQMYELMKAQADPVSEDEFSGFKVVRIGQDNRDMVLNELGKFL